MVIWQRKWTDEDDTRFGSSSSARLFENKALSPDITQIVLGPMP